MTMTDGDADGEVALITDGRYDGADRMQRQVNSSETLHE